MGRLSTLQPSASRRKVIAYAPDTLFLLLCLPFLHDPTSPHISLPSPPSFYFFPVWIYLLSLPSFSLNTSMELSLESYLHKTISEGTRVTFLYGPGSIALLSGETNCQCYIEISLWVLNICRRCPNTPGFRRKNSIPKPLKLKANCKLVLQWTYLSSEISQ